MKVPGGRRPLQLPFVPILLALLALLDLRGELQLLADHFTFASLVEIPRHHPLAIGVLVFTPWMIRCSR
jgi:hypothetical protein